MSNELDIDALEKTLQDLVDRVTRLEDQILKKTLRAKREKKYGVHPELGDGDERMTLAMEKVDIDLQKNWMRFYPDTAWLREEISKAYLWTQANPSRAPRKDFGRYYTQWLGRAYEKHRKSIRSDFVQKNPWETGDDLVR